MVDATRKVPVEVLHFAMPRTGSVSMMTAYNILGLTTYHGFNYIARPADQRKWENAIDVKFYGKGTKFTKEDFDQEDFLGPFQVLSDFPVLGFKEEFLEMYPEAKVVLVERDIEKWYHSFNTQVISALYTWMAQTMILFLDPYVMKARPATTMMKLQYAMFNCHDRRNFAANARETYQKHNEWVKSNVPSDRLLIYELGSGWEPLCKFLDKPVPDEPFPFKNESKEFAIWMRKVQTRMLKDGLWEFAKMLAVPAAVGLAGWALMRSSLLA